MAIRCKWMHTNRFLVNPDGQVFPCCYMCNSYFEQQQTGKEPTSKILKLYKEKEKDYNCNNKSLIDILNSEWFTETLPDSWLDNSIPSADSDISHICVRNCSFENGQYIPRLSKLKKG